MKDKKTFNMDGLVLRVIDHSFENAILSISKYVTTIKFFLQKTIKYKQQHSTLILLIRRWCPVFDAHRRLISSVNSVSVVQRVLPWAYLLYLGNANDIVRIKYTGKYEKEVQCRRDILLTHIGDPVRLVQTMPFIHI